MKIISLIVKILVTCAILAGGYFLGVRILREKPGATGSGEHGEAAAPDYERGPHGGRMLRDGNFAVEVTIYEPTPISPPSGPIQWLLQGPPAESNLLAAPPSQPPISLRRPMRTPRLTKSQVKDSPKQTSRLLRKRSLVF